MAGVVHISEEEAARGFGAIMKHIRSGDEVRLDCKDGVQAVVKRAASGESIEARGIDEIIEGSIERKQRKGLAVLDGASVLDAAEHSMPPNQPTLQRRTVAEAREILRRIEETEGLAVPDPDMASDMEEIHALYNQPMDMSRWD